MCRECSRITKEEFKSLLRHPKLNSIMFFDTSQIGQFKVNIDIPQISQFKMSSDTSQIAYFKVYFDVSQIAQFNLYFDPSTS